MIISYHAKRDPRSWPHASYLMPPVLQIHHTLASCMRAYVDNNVLLNTTIQNIHQMQRFTHLLLMGDFNCPEIDWCDNFVSGSDQSFSAMFFDSCQDAFLSQHVHSPTRYLPNQRPSVLDLVFTDDPDMIETVNHLPPIGHSDHECLFWSLVYACSPTLSDRPHVRWEYHKGAYDEMIAHLDQVQWESLFKEDIDQNWKIFKELLLQARDKFIPHRTVSANKMKPLWWNKSIGKAIKQKHKLFLAYKKSNLSVDYTTYKTQRNIVKALIKKSRANYEAHIAENIKSAPKKFYGYINSKRKIRSSVGPLENQHGEIVSDLQGCTEILGSFFQSVFTDEDTGNIPEFPYVTDMRLSDIPLTVDTVYRKLASLNVCKAQGPDDIHPYILKECRESLCYPLLYIFRKSLDTGTIPQDWKTANVTPIFKKGQKQKANNYRPISLLSQAGKILESIIRDVMTKFFTENNLINKHQHGFVSGKSCLTNLLESFEDWTSYLDNPGISVDIIFLDFRKAFDTVPHCRLLKKLSSYGICDNLLNWLSSFLINRTQQVVLHGHKSDSFVVRSGVPQGSVLGPLLFLLYVNDLPGHVSSEISMFADDTKIYHKIKNIADCHQLQSDLDKLNIWSKEWLLSFNIEKCKYMRLGNNETVFNYTMFNADKVSYLLQTFEETDLGIAITPSMNFSSQVNKSYTKAMQALSMIKRSFKFLNNKIFLLLYRVFIRPHLEYCVQAWCPYLCRDIDKLEKVQRRATKLLPNLTHLPYPDRLKILGLYSLYYRRIRGDLILTYRILNKHIKIDSNIFFSLSTVTHTRGHQLKLYKPPVQHLPRQKIFSNRIINEWNSLPEYVVSATSINDFKNRLDNYWRSSRHGHSERPTA